MREDGEKPLGFFIMQRPNRHYSWCWSAEQEDERKEQRGVNEDKCTADGDGVIYELKD